MKKARNREPSVPYLVHRIAVRIEESINAKAKKYGLRISEIRILMRLLDGGDLRVGELAQMASIEVSALSHILRRMTEAGWVTRTRAVRDSRLVLVSLTEKGRGLATLLRPYIRRYNDLAIRRIPEPDIALLREVLGRIYENVISMADAMPEFPDLPAPSPAASGSSPRAPQASRMPPAIDAATRPHREPPRRP